MMFTVSGHEVILDDDIFDMLNELQYKCRIQYVTNNKNPYIVYRGGYLHRQIMGCSRGDGTIVDHINGNTLDNRRENLRFVTAAANCRNANKRARKVDAAGTVKYKGVWSEKRGNKVRYRACIYPNGKSISLGTFKTPEEAAKAYDQAAATYYGEHARLNLPP